MFPTPIILDLSPSSVDLIICHGRPQPRHGRHLTDDAFISIFINKHPQAKRGAHCSNPIRAAEFIANAVEIEETFISLTFCKGRS